MLNVVHRIVRGLPLLGHSSSIVCCPCDLPDPGQGIVLDGNVPDASVVVGDLRQLMVLD